MDWLTHLNTQTIVEGGAVIVALSALYYMGRANDTIQASNKLYFNHTNDTIEKVAEAIKEQAVSNQRVADVVDRNTQVIELHFNKINERISSNN